MLNSFRSMAGSLWAKALLVLLVCSFGVWGIGDMLRAPGTNQNVATVGNRSISAREFQQELRNETENMREVLGDHYTPEAIKSLGLPPRALQKLVGHKLLALESEALGLMPSDADVAARIRSNQGLQDKQGNFDKHIFEAMLRNTNQSEKSYTDQLRENMAINLLLDTLLAKLPAPDIAARTLMAAHEEQRTATLYILKPSLVTDIAQPADADITAYYKAHQNDFTAPESRTASYIVITQADLHKNDTVTDEQIQAAYKDRVDEFKRPERRAVEQLLYPAQADAQKAADMLKAGKSVAEVAKALPPLNKDALSLGKVGHSTILENASDAVFALKVGENTAPIQSPFGWHVFHVSAIEPPAIAPLAEVRPQIEKELKQQVEGDAQSKLANKLEDELAGGSTLTEVAAGQGLKVLSAGTFGRDGNAPDGSKDAAIPDLDKFVETAFKTDEKTESGLVPTKGGSFYLLRTESVTPERVRPMAEVKDKVIAGWQKEQRLKKLDTLSADMAKSFATPAERSAVIAKYNLAPLPVVTLKRSSRMAGDLSLPPSLVDSVFGHRPGEATGAAPLKDDDYAIAVVGATIPAPAPDKDPKLVAELADMKNSLQNTVGNEILDEYTHYLMSKYPVALNEAALQAASN